ncbi:MAG: CAP domain-containing protein [Thermoleophilaceae bacterium]|nr:CAP domain-containing protein [Thermoleophilaceae bacterium]
MAAPSTEGAGAATTDVAHVAKKKKTKKTKKRRKTTRKSRAPVQRGPCAGADTVPSVDVETAEKATVCLLNQERAAKGLGAVSANGDLSVAADRHAQDMVSKKYFSHDAPGGSDFVDRILRAGYVRPTSLGWLLGENLAWGSGALGTPRNIVESWMDSPGHRANVLKGEFENIGVAIVLGAPAAGVQNAATYASEYGRR